MKRAARDSTCSLAAARTSAPDHRAGGGRGHGLQAGHPAPSTSTWRALTVPGPPFIKPWGRKRSSSAGGQQHGLIAGEVACDESNVIDWGAADAGQQLQGNGSRRHRRF